MSNLNPDTNPLQSNGPMTSITVDQKLQRQLRQQVALAQLGQLALARQTTFEQLLETATRLLTEVLEVEFSLVSELISEAKTRERTPKNEPVSENTAAPRFLLRAGVGWQENVLGQAIIEGGTLSQAGYTLMTGQPVLMKTVQAETRFSLSPIHEKHGIVSALTVVIGGQDQEQPYGVLGTASSRPLQFEPEDLQFLQSVANIIAMAYQREQDQQALLDQQAQLRQAQKMESVGRLAGGVAHDFNNLLTAINGYSEILLMSLPSDSPFYADLEQIKGAGDRAAALTRQLLAFSRQQVLRSQPLNLNEIVEDIHKLLDRLLGEDVELITLTDPALGQVLADPSQLEQVLVNLAVNARDAMDQGGRLTIETANVELDEAYQSTTFDPQFKTGPYVMLAVSDTGTGMDTATQEKIFDPFFTTKEAGKGTGLGLSTVYGIVQQSGGYILVYSELGVGTTFKVYLPRLETSATALANAAAANTAVAARETTQNRHILVVEDDNAVRELIQRVLSETGYTLTVTGNGQTALDAFASPENQTGKGPIELVLTDIIMPGMGGVEMVRQLRQQNPRLRVLCMSGYTDRALEGHQKLDWCDGFLQKPFTPSALRAKIAELLNLARPPRDQSLES